MGIEQPLPDPLDLADRDLLLRQTDGTTAAPAVGQQDRAFRYVTHRPSRSRKHRQITIQDQAANPGMTSVNPMRDTKFLNISADRRERFHISTLESR